MHYVHKYQSTMDGFAAWIELLKECDKEGSQLARNARLAAVIQVPFSNKTPGGVVLWLDTFQSRITELGLTDPCYETQKQKMLQLIQMLSPCRMFSTQIKYVKLNKMDFDCPISYIR